MKKFLFFALISWQLTQAQSTINDTITVDGLERNFILYVPASYDGTSPVPLVINLHGYGSDAPQQALYGNFRNLADVDNFLIVQPNGTFDLSGTRYWNAFVNSGAVDDVNFISELIDSLSEDYNIDQSKVFSTGMSNGGFMSYKLACELSGKIAKIASVTGSMNTMLENTCNPGKAVPVMQIHGTADPTVAYNGSIGVMAIEDVVDFWVNNNNCNPTPLTSSLPDINTADNSTVQRFVYTGGDNNSEVIFYKITNGGHTWPDAFFDIPAGNTNKDFNASQVIWEFFKGAPFVGIKDQISSEAVQVILKGNTLQIELSQDLHLVKASLYNALGQIHIESKSTSLNFDNAASGLYFLVIQTKEGNYYQSLAR
ncbi:MAG: hypothetical protein KDC82_07015 [Bacteroidetes bacterium]|nr:hypothetical protein [Bacteroidota bacterium]